MNLITRRLFLERSVVSLLSAAGAALFGVPPFLQRALAAGVLPENTKKMLFIFLRGGNDALNTIIPWADSAYNLTNRPTLYIPPPDPLSSVPGQMVVTADLTRAIDLGNGFAGAHPALAEAAPLFNAGQLALIHRVGYPKQSRSHFDSQRYWENGVPRDNFLNSGIFYRAVVDTGLYQGRAFPAVSVQSSSPLLLRGAIAMPSLADPSRYDLLGVTANAQGQPTDKTKLLNAIDAQHRIPYPEKDNRQLLFATGQGLKASIEALKSVGVDRNDFFDTDGTTHLFPIDAASNQKGFGSAAYGFFRNLKVAAQILAGTDAVVTGTQLDGFDTHSDQGQLSGQHASLLRQIAWGTYAVRKFLTDANPALWQNTVIVTLSEFGRTTKENGNEGTDHAEAGTMFVAGGKVKGGVYQCSNDSWTIGPTGSMFQVNNRYLRRSVDYRSVLGEVIRDHLGATPEQLKTIIPGYADPRENLQTGGVAPDGTRIVGELGLV
jgi:uncharacterized protein (DUF1501 family)